MRPIDTTPKTEDLRRPEWLDTEVWPFPVNTLHTSNGRVAYTDVGSGPPLLFLNAPQWSMVWRDTMTLLEDDFRCIALDAPGLGLSDRIEPDLQHLGTVRDAVTALIDLLDLSEATLVVHDLGGLSGLAAASRRPEAFTRLVAVNTFGWKPRGILLPVMLAMFGSAAVRWFDSATKTLPFATSGPFGVGRTMEKPSRLAFRRAFDRPATTTMHRLFANAARNDEIHSEAAEGLAVLAENEALTVFGGWGDYLRFRRQWRQRLPELTEVSIPRGIHFPMNDNPPMVAGAIAAFHGVAIQPEVP